MDLPDTTGVPVPDSDASDDDIATLTALLQQRRGPEFLLLDDKLNVVFSCPPTSAALGSLEPELRQLTATTLAKMSRDGSENSGWQPYRAGIFVRHIVIQGPGVSYVAAFFERSRSKTSLAGIAARFNLSPRESEVLTLLVRGLDTKGVAHELSIARTTARDHIVRIMQKTRSQRRAQLLALAIGARL